MPDKDTLISLGTFEELAPREELLNNQMYTTRHFRGKYRPLKTGKISISPNIHLQIQSTFRNMMGFGRSTIMRSHTLKVQPLNLQCIDVPNDKKPENYSNAIGKFNVYVKAEPLEVAVGDIITLTTTVSGSGYLSEASPPIVITNQDFKKYAPRITTDTEDRKTFEQIFIPTSTNATQIESVTFTWFDPAQTNSNQLSKVLSR